MVDVIEAMDRMSARGIDHVLSWAKSVQAPFYREFAPPPDLAGYVACSWVRVVRCAIGETSDAILPDGCADIMLYDDQPPRVAGPDAVTRQVTVWDGLTIFGVRLRPGACRAVLGCSAAEIVNGSVLLSDVVSQARELHCSTLASANPFDRLRALEHWVRSALKTTNNDRAVITACRLLGAGSTVDVGDVAHRLDWNARMMHRQFVAACGYSPKHFQRIMCIQQTLRIANRFPSKRLADLAAAAGFADQSNMTRDFRDITGFTPSVYLASRLSPGWSAWIDEGW
jgi:AraC-like DNA-binding protein